MWEIIRGVKERGTSIVLTTHSMEEAEALADRMAIQHLGQFRALGSIQQLKDKFNKGFEVDIKFNKPFMLNEWIKAKGLEGKKLGINGDRDEYTQIFNEHCYGQKDWEDIVSKKMAGHIEGAFKKSG